MSNITAEEALTILRRIDTVNLDNVLDSITNMEKIQYLKQHPYDIFYSNSDNRWHSYLPDNTKKSNRRSIAKSKKEDLEYSIIAYYKGIARKKQSPGTFEQLYPLWYDYKLKETSNANVHKLNWVWEKYFKNDSLVKKSIVDIRVLELKEWYLNKIQTEQLTSKKYKEMKSLLNMLFDFAIEKEIVSSNVSRNVKGISRKKFVPKKLKCVTEQVFIDNEEEQIIALALDLYNKTKNTAYLAVCLNFTLALRVGELVALSFTDFTENSLHIQRQEIKDYCIQENGALKRNGYKLVSYTKSITSDRYLPLTSKAKEFLSMIKKDTAEKEFLSEYLFLDKHGKRMHNDAINRALRYLNSKIGTIQKANHSIRKTCLSNMSASNLLSDEEIRMFAGHKEISTTQNSYIFATESLENRIDAYEVAICSKV